MVVSDGGVLRFGLAPATWDARIDARLSAFSRALAAQIGMSVLPIASSDYRGIVGAIARGEVDVAWLPPLVALRGVAEGSLLPLALPIRGGVSSFSAVLFAQRGSGIHAVEDLRGKRVAWVDRQSASGYLVVRAHLEEIGVDPDTMFSREVFCGTHPRVVYAVATGDADVGATYACIDSAGQLRSAAWIECGLPIDVEIVLATSHVPADVVAMSRTTPAQEGRLVQDALIGARPGSPLSRAIGELFHAEGFELPAPSHFAPLARVLHAMGDPRRFPSVPPPR